MKTWGLPHAKFAQQDANFIQACEAAGVKPTKRQAAKFRRGRGSAYAHRLQNAVGRLGSVVGAERADDDGLFVDDAGHAPGGVALVQKG